MSMNNAVIDFKSGQWTVEVFLGILDNDMDGVGIF